MTPKNIIATIKEGQPNIKSVVYVGCGASQADLYPAKYFLEENSKDIRVSLYTANEFNYATPKAIDSSCIVITASLGGTTPETVEATSKAKRLGAHVITLTHIENSPITKGADYVLVHGFEKNYAAKLEKMTLAVQLAVEILYQFEGYDNYKEMINGFDKIYNLIEESVSTVLPEAKKFADSYKDDKIIYLMSSGATAKVAYSTSLCLLMEMQWVNSGNFHNGEFFHGPFEIVDKNVPFLLFMNDGKTRPMDSRALTFLQRFDAKITVIDAKDFGISSVISPKVVDYFNPMLISGVMRIYAEQLAIARNHPLTKRRYMWKLEY
ncbi:SIS domain-containing protein [Clostridium sp. MB40-C1]|uniref:SIS domain-containing protein n=1 Tax=Clostridium sp. MB40-C1 TaxID=3070996 RepID=UPI0027DF0A99|nr:SIS domain-containing protein [Clostridium sp. MB40-C1]WMJ79312.1 SIS domain-containing protein [Clostridium sp. MB40-C1]